LCTNSPTRRPSHGLYGRINQHDGRINWHDERIHADERTDDLYIGPHDIDLFARQRIASYDSFIVSYVIANVADKLQVTTRRATLTRRALSSRACCPPISSARPSTWQ
jgi:hypothetical protein